MIDSGLPSRTQAIDAASLEHQRDSRLFLFQGM